MKKHDNLPYHIYWFSGCGNSLLIAIEINKHLSQLGCDAKLFPMEKVNPASIDKSAIIGFVIPVAGQGTYPIVWDFLKGLPYVEGTPCFLVDTLGIYSGGILGPVKSIVQRKGFVPLAAKEILMPNVFQKRKNDPEKEKKKTENGKYKAREFCDRLVDHKGSWFDIPGYSWLMSLFYRSTRSITFYRKLFPLVLNLDNCIQCGLCVKLCPVGHLTMKGEKSIPEQGTTCILCHRCFAYCPTRAITIGNKKAVVYHALPLDALLLHLKEK